MEKNWMKGMRGAIVMIEPKTGEIRALVTSPSFDPSMLYGKNRGDNFKALEADPNKPLFQSCHYGYLSSWLHLQDATSPPTYKMVPSRPNKPFLAIVATPS